jgi:CelD/BcsL family acetyltransferase involved in cellulose biosynthesis
VGQGEFLVAGDARVTVEMLSLSDLDEDLTSAWRHLECRAAECNAYLSPDFVLPALRHLRRDPQPLLLLIWRRDGIGQRLIGLGVFVPRKGRRRFPLPHLEAYRCPHTFLTGILMDRDDQQAALEALCVYLSMPRVPWFGVEFMERLGDGLLDRVQCGTGDFDKVRWHQYYGRRRAILVPAARQDPLARVHADSHADKELRRKWRRLEEKGQVEWGVAMGRQVNADCTETFLRLEDQGWKRERGKSMLSRPGHAAFFREMIESFGRDGRVFFAELRVGGRVIASTSNLVSGNLGFAFKIGWDPEFAKLSPGILNEREFVRRANDLLSHLAYIDSGAEQGSYIEELWPDRVSVVSGVLVAGRIGKALLPAIVRARELKRRLLR